MAEHIELPGVPTGTPEEALREMYSYLYRMARTMNINLDEIGSGSLTDEEQALMNELSAGGTAEGQLYSGQHNYREAETLKSLILKTASFVKEETDNYRLALYGDTEAEGQFGKYRRKTGVRVDVTPEGIRQTFSFAEVVQGLKTFEINAKNYIKTGLLRTVQGVPVYGVAIGKDVVTFSEDGTETYNDGNKVAELTADELSFYQNGNLCAKYTGDAVNLYAAGVLLEEMKGTAMTFFQNSNTAVKISASGMEVYSAGVKIADLNGSALNFYQNNKTAAKMTGSGMEIYQDGNVAAKMTSGGMEVYQAGTVAMKNTANGMEIYSGGTKIADLNGSALNFYQNNKIAAKSTATGMEIYQDGTVAAKLTSGGMEIYSGGTKIADLKGSELNFYQNNKIAAKMTGSGMEIYQDGKTAAKLTSGGMEVYQAETIAMKNTASGMEVYSGGTKIADLKGTELNFYQNSQLSAKYTNSRVGFYNAGTEVMYITGNKIYASGDLEINTGKTLKVNSGGAFDVTSSNFILDSSNNIIYIDATDFTLDSQNRKLITGKWSIYDLGINWKDDNATTGIESFSISKHVSRNEIRFLAKEFNYNGGGWALDEAGNLLPVDRLLDVYPNIGDSTRKPRNLYCKNLYYENMTQNSSRERKHGIEPLEEMGGKIDRLVPVRFVYNGDAEERVRFGLIHEDTADVMPEICIGEKDARAEEKGISYTELVPVLLKEIQDLRRRVSELEKRKG